MTEFWVSQSKHYCKYCKVWMADNKPSIRHHESGKRHKEAVDLFFKDKREAKFQGSRSESELNKQLREIEQAALEQSQQDAAMFGGAHTAPILPRAPPPPPSRLKPPPPPPGRDYNSGYKQEGDKNEKAPEAEEGEGEAEEEKPGRYKIGDITYLEGKHHEDKLVTGQPCQIWVEAEDKWIEDANIVSVKITAIPNTDIVIRKCNISYKLKPEDEEPREEEEVNSDRIRLMEDQVEEPKPPAPAPVNEMTGLGGWQTVSVRVVDEEAEKKAGQDAILLEELERKEREAKKRLRMMEDAMEGEDAMSSYDPHNRGMYKGFDLKATVEATSEVDLGGDKDGPVAFKKRKTGATAGNGEKKNKGFRSRKSKEDDD